jgi:hypothetical protein
MGGFIGVTNFGGFGGPLLGTATLSGTVPDTATLTLSAPLSAGSDQVSGVYAGGGGFFRSQFVFPAVATPFSVAAAALTTDLKIDLVTADVVGNGVSVLFGNGDGTFQAPETFATGNFPVAVAVADVNGDGTFQPPRSFATGREPLSLALGDVNGDGKADLIAANESDDTVSVLLGNGNGTFQDPLSPALGRAAGSVAVGDFNGDGIPDLVVTNYGSGSVGVLLGLGDGMFSNQVSYYAGGQPEAVVLADLTGDRDLDLVVADRGGHNVSVLNGDGIPDIVVTNYLGGGIYSSYDGHTLTVLLGNGNGTFGHRQTIATGLLPSFVAAADVNGDGRLDLVVAPSGTRRRSQRVLLLILWRWRT